MSNILQIFHLGSVISWILLVLYFLILTISLERFCFFYVTRSNFRTIYKQLSKNNKITLKSKYKNSQVAQLIQSYSLDSLSKQIERQVFIFIDELSKNSWILYKIANIAPLLGLLGTILGLISSFKVMATLGDSANISTFASGIWEAMITTALGLIVAIPALLLHKIIDKTVEKRSYQFSLLVSLLNDYSQKKQEIIIDKELV